MSKKKKNHDRIMSLIEKMGIEYAVLNKGDKGLKNHIRIDDLGDIWPTSGTMHCPKSKVWIKKDVEAVTQLLMSLASPDMELDRPERKSKDDRITELENQVSKLLDYNDRLEEEVCYIKQFLSI